MAEALTSEQILEAAQRVLRRFGPAKATVVDVARALGVSHGSVYRHFPSKLALRDAVLRRWLEHAHAPVTLAARAGGPAPARLRNWLATLFDTKRHKACDDPELFATYSALVAGTSGVIADHVAEMIAQIAGILRDGIEAGEFTPVADVELTARAVLDATTRFHNPVFATRWTQDGIDKAFDATCDLVLKGLSS
ncbi:AcrR family transcriptional regulator [Kibdelosporangium banguiense]|uniref:AcrR family transcriptional regulator n=1 Tax=Kibdelosporangium banguiense TaxID=1365924 RepID=A0ABS4U4F4_9PSEU|nr:TetR family transcriptional regulator [Kibdelosporangium banguiense]MBP2331088.1 AcrR family transcriptional regulator [Kibdelosporangium banguiense]